MATDEKYEITDARITSVFSNSDVFVDGEGNEHPERYQGFTVSWGAKDIGFGELTLKQHEDGRVELDTEAMSKDFVKAVFAKLVEQADGD